MTKTSSDHKREEKMVTKIGRSVVAVKTQLLEWVVGPTPGIALTQSSYMQGILVLVRVKGYLQTHM